MPLDAKTIRLREARLARDAAGPKPTPSSEHHRVFGLEDEIPFGKHRGETLEFVIDADVGYVTWLLGNTQFEMSPAAEREYRYRLDPRRPIDRSD